MPHHDSHQIHRNHIGGVIIRSFLYYTTSCLSTMRSSMLRALQAGTCAINSTSQAASRLLPIKYHVFRNPLPYPLGLILQNDIIDRRLERKAQDPSRPSQDIILFLGQPSLAMQRWKDRV